MQVDLSERDITLLRLGLLTRLSRLKDKLDVIEDMRNSSGILLPDNWRVDTERDLKAVYNETRELCIRLGRACDARG